jgi:DHA1 family multidrug resistance protein-like MFS transporter
MQSTMIKKVFPILALCVFSATLGIGIISPLLPLYVRDMGATGVGLGVIMACYAISNSVAVPIIGRLSDRKGRKVFLTIGLLAYALISIGYIYSTNVVQLSMVRLSQGIAGAMTTPIAIAYLGDLSPEGEEGRWMGYANAAFFSGFGFGPFIGGIVTEQINQTAAFLILIGLNMLAFLIALVFLPEAQQRRTGEEFRPSFREMGRSDMVKGLFSFRMAQAIGRGGISAFLPIFAAMIGLSTTLIGILLAINIMAVTALAPVGGRIADKFNRRTLIIATSIIFSVILGTIPFAGSFSHLLVLLLIQGLSASVAMPAASALVVEEGRKYGMGSTMSTFFLAMSIGTALGPIISGGISDVLNVNWVFYFGAAMTLVGLLFFIWFTRQYRGFRPDAPNLPGNSNR